MSEATESNLDQEVKALSRITDRRSLVALSYALRHPETWPEDFVWDYGACDTCAIGLALTLWPEMKLPRRPDEQEEWRVQETWIAREMALPLREAKYIFFGLGPTIAETVRTGFFTKEVRYFQDFSAVTPDDVADAIDCYLASVE